MKANNSLRINMPRALELIFFFFLGHGLTYPISDLSGSAITRGNCTEVHLLNWFFQIIFIKVCGSVTFETPCIYTNRTSHYVVAFVSFAIDTNIFSATNLI